MRIHICALASSACALTAIAQPKIDFHEHWVEQRWLAADPASQKWISSLRKTLPDAPPQPAQPPCPEPSFDDPRSMLRFVLSSAPAVAIVYPTETYYYYSMTLADRRISGNIRFLDAAKGTIHIGYFDNYDRSSMNYGSFTSADGLQISAEDNGIVRVAMDGFERTFLVTPVGLKSTPPSLLPSEHLIAGILDESGYFFHLIHEQESGGFYYVLNESMPLPESLHPVHDSDNKLLVGETSRFVFLNDAAHNRKILCGVHRKQVIENNYFDGAFDQVPPRLPIKDRLIRAYPYVVHRGGIDDHGNFIELQGQRVAISPYLTYSSMPEMIGWMHAAQQKATSPTSLWAAITYESKRHFNPDLADEHAQSQQYAANSPIFVRQGWPANHFAGMSESWPAEHLAPHSRTWPANHAGESSLLMPAVPLSQTPPATQGPDLPDTAISASAD